MPEQIGFWTDALQRSVSSALMLFVSAIPNVIAFLLLLAAGWLIASLAARAATALLSRVRFNNWVHRSGLSDTLSETGVDLDAIGFVALTVKWFIRLIALVVAFDALGLVAVSDTLRQLLLWLPNLVVALVILVLGGLAANALYAFARASLISAEFRRPDLLASIARVAVWAFAIVLAIYQVGIAVELVTAVFTALVAGFALAVGLAFGLGGREVAGEIVRDLYERARPSQHIHKQDEGPRSHRGLAPQREH
jgi:hypothetical protein